MTAPFAVRQPTGIADPNNPTNVLVPALSYATVVTAVTANGALLSPVVLSLVASANGNAKVVLQNSSTPVILTLTKGVPSTPQMRIVQVRTTGLTTGTLTGLY